MGVQGLWQLLEKTGRPITLDVLEGKRLAVDISLWLCQAAYGYNTYSFGSRSPHIQLLISRISKLLFYNIHPIFVFDGKNVPPLKKQVLNERALRRHMDDIRLNKKQRTMLEQLAKQQLTSSNPNERIAAEQQLWTKLVNQRSNDVFELPNLPSLPKLPEVTNSLSEDSSSSDDDFLDVISISQPSTSNTSQPSSIKDERIDLEILNERAKNTNPTFSQLINIKSTASQTGYLIDYNRAEEIEEPNKLKKNNKRKSSELNPSHKKSEKAEKSVLPRFGPAEDDWLPNSVINVDNSTFKANLETIIMEKDASDDLIEAECQQLLSILGLPYLVANGEAEAQCVELERMGLCDGVVTEDSDAWLFGVQKCYKNMFNRRAQVEEYDSKKIKEELGLTREKFVAIAMLSGGDYCNGFDGIGCITALKLINEVGYVRSNQDNEEGFKCLQRIRTWLDSKTKWQAKNKGKLFREPKIRIRIRRTIETKNDEARIEAFPNEEVYSAYMKPDVNEDSQHFEWQPIEFEALHEFIWSKIGWSPEDLKTHTYRSLNNWNKFVISQKS